MDADEIEGAGVQNDGKTGDPIWCRNLGSEGRTCEEIGSSGDEMFTSHQRSNKTRENEKRRHKAGIEGGGTEREDTRM